MKIECAHDEVVDLDLLVPNPRNANDHPEAQIKLLAKIMAHQGWRNPIVVSKRSGFITKGHGRLMAAKLNAWSKAPIDYQEYASEADEWADMIADNKIAELAESNEMRIQEIALDLGKDFDFDLFGIPDFALVDPEALPPGADEDEMPEHVEPRTKLGDIYQLGKHRLMCGDSTSIDAVETLMDGQMADMVFTDPPYNVAVTGGNRDPKDKKNFGKGPKIENDDMTNEEFKQFLRGAFTCLYAVTKPGSVIYVAHADSEVINFRSAFVESGFLLKQCLIWVKQRFVFGRSDYHWQHEPILYGWREGAGHKFYGERNQSTTWNIDRPMQFEKEHPTQKPVALVEKAIANSSKLGELMFEPFGGGGSTLVAAEKLGRRCNAMELDPKYCDVIVARWEKYTGKTAVLLTGEKQDAS